MKSILYVLGVTCSGKSTLIKKIEAERAGSRSCLIGQVLRSKYPPEFFRGMAALPDTEPEVIKILQDAIEEFLSSNDTLLMVDGAPRLQPCFEFCSKVAESVPSYYLLLDVTCAEELDRRSKGRDSDNPEKLRLSQTRINTDKQLGYDILVSILKDYDALNNLFILDTTNGIQSDAIEQLLSSIEAGYRDGPEPR